MRLRLLLLFLITLTFAGCGGGGGGGTSNNTPQTPTETVTVFAGGNKTLNGIGDTKTIDTATASSSTGSSLTYAWTVTSGDPNNIVFGSPNALTTTISAKALGTYTVKLTATSTANPAISNSDSATISVIAPTGSEVLSVNAGEDVSATGPGSSNAITLLGSANYVLGPVTYTWGATGTNADKVHFGSPNAAVTTFWADAPGTYNVFLSVTSTGGQGATATDEAVVTVADDTVLGAKQSYFPLNPGRVWVYQENGTSNTVRKEVLNDLTIYSTITSSTSGTSHNDARYTFFNNRVYLTEITADSIINGSTVTFTTSYNFNNTNTADPGLLILPSSLTSGTAESSSYNTATYTTLAGATPTARTATVTVMGIEPFTLNGSTYDAVKLRTVTSAPTTSYSWYVKGIGLVKDDRYTLISYTP